MSNHQSIVTGVPDYPGASEVAKSLLDLPTGVDEEEIRSRTREILGRLFPKLKYPEIASQFNTGDGAADVVCRNLVVEAKGDGKMRVARRHPDRSLETPEQQLERYLTAIRQEPDIFYDPVEGWRGVVTDGKQWDFYRFDPDSEPGTRLIPDGTHQLDRESSIGPLLFRLHDAIDKVSKIAPPTHDDSWARSKAKGFADLAYDVRTADSFQMKLTLWRDMLEGAFITAPSQDADEIQLFASHTMLVLIARAVSDAIRPLPEASQQDGRTEGLTRGFAAWLIDVGGEDGRNLIEDLVTDVGRFECRRSERDNLKDLYHAVIPRDIPHDFGEYYTPDWLARAVCEEVLDGDWRREVVEEWVTGRRSSPAVLDPSCGSGTFLYHATQLILETAAEHPDLADSPIAQVEAANALVAGMDLHPVAVELAKTTKALAFAGKGVALLPDDDPNVFLGDSLQWSLKTNRVTGFDENVVEIPTADGDDPIRLPRSLVLSDRFSQYLSEMFDLANMEDYERAEKVLLDVLDLRSKFEREMVVKEFRRFQEYKRTGRNHVWHWYIANLVQPLRLGEKPMTRLIGNPPWVVYNSMAEARQDNLRSYAMDRRLWASARLAPHNDLAATFVATCVDEYLAGGGRFGFVMPYAMLKASQWAPFRSGDWTSAASAKATKVDMSEPAWDMTAVHAPPFAHVQSSVVFGTKMESDNGNKSGVPMTSMLRPVGNGKRQCNRPGRYRNPGRRQPGRRSRRLYHRAGAIHPTHRRHRRPDVQRLRPGFLLHRRGSSHQRPGRRHRGAVEQQHHRRLLHRPGSRLQQHRRRRRPARRLRQRHRQLLHRPDRRRRRRAGRRRRQPGRHGHQQLLGHSNQRAQHQRPRHRPAQPPTETPGSLRHHLRKLECGFGRRPGHQ